MRCLPFLLLLALSLAAQSRSVIVLPAGPDLDPGNRTATILDLDTWKPLGHPSVGIDAYQAFTLPDSTKTYVVARGATHTVTVLGDLSTGGPVLKVIGLPQGSTDAVLTPDGKRLLLVSLSDAALTIINTTNDRVMARVPLAAPANSVVVNFESTQAFAASPAGALISQIALTTNTSSVWHRFTQEVKASSQLVYAPNGKLYLVAGDLLQEFDPRPPVATTASSFAAAGAIGRPHFAFVADQALLVSPSSVRLANLKRPGASESAGVGFDFVRVVSDSLAIGYSSVNRTFARIHLKPALAVSPMPGLASFADGPVAGLGGTQEDPQHRYLFLSSGSKVHRFDLEANLVTATHDLGRPAGLPIGSRLRSPSPALRIYATDLTPARAAPIVYRALDANGLPVPNAQVTLMMTDSSDAGYVWTVASNADGYVQTAAKSSSGYSSLVFAGGEIDSGDSSTPTVNVTPHAERDQPGGPTRIAVFSGNGQIVDAGEEAPRVVQVLVTGEKNGRESSAGISGVPVNWSVTAGGGRLRWARTLTDSRGIATNAFIGPELPPSSAPAASAIVAGGEFGSPVTFNLTTARPWRTSGVTRLAPSSRLNVTAGVPSPGALRYRILTQAGLGLAGIGLDFGANSSGVNCANQAISDATGLLACDLLVRGPLETVRVFIGGRRVEDLPLRVAPGPAARIRIIGGHRDWRRVYLPRGITVVSAVVEDRYGNRVNGAQVTWTGPATNPVTLSAPGRYTDPRDPSVSRQSDGVISNTIRSTNQNDDWINLELGAHHISPSIVLADPTALNKLDGDGQSAPAGHHFDRPLQIQLSNVEGRLDRLFGAGMRGFPVTFTYTGDLVLSTLQTVTDVQGRAEVSVLAGSAPGTHTVTARAGTASATFRLTVNAPAAPAIRSLVNGASLAPGLAPCAIAQLSGVNLAGAQITFGALAAPIRSATPETVVFQVPCELGPGPATLTLMATTGTVSQAVTLAALAPGIFGIAKADGTPVSAANPVKPGEEVLVSVTGLGQATPAIATNVPGAGQRVNAAVLVGLNNEGVAAEAVYAPALVGTYFVTFRVPANATAGPNRPFVVAVQGADGALVFSQPATLDIQPE